MTLAVARERSGVRSGGSSETARSRYRRAGMIAVMSMLMGALGSSCAGQHSDTASPRMSRPATTTVTAVSPRRGYWLMRADGQIFAFGRAVNYGSDVHPVNRALVCLSSTPSGRGYWLVAADGGIFAFGDAHYYGSTGAVPLARPIVGMASTRSGRGYWLVTADGTVFAFGDAGLYGSMAARPLNQPVVGMAATANGRGYWLVAADGAVFGFGNARYYGSASSVRVDAPIVGMSPSPSGRGYLLAASDGRVFAFGNARLYPAHAASAATRQIVALGATPSGRGYWLAAADGTVVAYGDAPSESPASGVARLTTTVGMAGVGGAGMCHAVARPADVAPQSGATPGEGHWVAVARPVGGEPAIFTTTLRARSDLPAAGLAWIDANRVVFRLYAGAGQPSGTFRYSGFVDPASQVGLLATFNAGFKVDASEGGWAAYDTNAIPLRDGAASFIIRSDGTATVGMWGRDARADARVVAVRQNLRLLIDGGKVANDLSPKSWGAVFGGGATTWRSGLGVDANGHLVYAVGAHLLPIDLARLLLAAGAVRAMQLDINRVVSFSTFTAPAGSARQPIVGTNLLPSINFDPARYLHPGGRDFIAVFAA